MAVSTAPRPDLLAYREAITLHFPKLVTELTAILGKKLTAYIASVKDTRAIERWMAGSEPYKGVDERLRFAYRLAKMISDHEGQRVVQACSDSLQNGQIEIDYIPAHQHVGVEFLHASAECIQYGAFIRAARGTLRHGATGAIDDQNLVDTRGI